jgi:tetratricopeptide (TPR) repeat protein
MHQFAQGWGDIRMQVSALNKLGFVQALRLRRVEDAALSIVEAERLARDFDDIRGLVEAATVKCGMCLPTGDFSQAIDSLGESVQVARTAPDMREELASALGHLALTMTYSTRFDDAWQAAQECRRVAEQLGNRSHVAEVMVFPIPLYLLRTGDADAALSAAEEGMQIATEIGDAQNMMYGALMLARLRSLRGDHDSALRYARMVVDMGPHLGDFATYVLPMGLAELLSASLAISGPVYEEAMRAHAEMFKAMEPFFDALSCAELGFCALARADVAGAEAWFRRGLEKPTSSWLLERPRLFAGRAQVAITCADLSAARRFLDEGRTFAEQRQMQHMYPLLDLVQARLAVALNETERAVELFRAAAEGAARLRMQPIAEQARAGVV